VHIKAPEVLKITVYFDILCNSKLEFQFLCSLCTICISYISEGSVSHVSSVQQQLAV